MNANIQALLSELGMTHTGEVAVADIVFNTAFRDACVANACGKYGTNWTCPPAVGEPADLIARAQKFTRGLVLQTVWPLEDVFDFDGMMAGYKNHNALFRKAAARVVPLLASGPTLALSAGACAICETCTFPRGEPCRLPQQALPPLESYCIDVAALIDAAGLAYTNGPNTVSYVGLILS
jgi:predicted metal-binding protein